MSSVSLLLALATVASASTNVDKDGAGKTLLETKPEPTRDDNCDDDDDDGGEVMALLQVTRATAKRHKASKPHWGQTYWECKDVKANTLLPGEGDGIFWRCMGNSCIEWTHRCDGTRHCVDASDEFGCGKAYNLVASVGALEARHAQIRNETNHLRTANAGVVIMFNAFKSQLDAFSSNLTAEFSALNASFPNMPKLQADIDELRNHSAKLQADLVAINASSSPERGRVVVLRSNTSAELQSAVNVLRTGNKALQESIDTIKNDYTRLKMELRK